MIERVDKLLVKQGLAPTRSKAQDLIVQGKVLHQGQVITKSSLMLAQNTPLILDETETFVGRGGEKLKKGLEALQIPIPFPSHWVAADIGASTGGFTQYLLSQNLAKVYAIDVGHDQLDPTLRNDPRVINREGCNIKLGLTLPELVDLVVVDLSFISLEKVLSPITDLLKPQGLMILLFKPQFEVGREGLNKKGIVKDPQLAHDALHRFTEWVSLHFPLKECKIVVSALKGRGGNQEYFLSYLKAE